jgi:hypothetical protein
MALAVINRTHRGQGLAGWIQALFFGDFLLGQQKKVTRHAGAEPGGLPRTANNPSSAQRQAESRRIKPNQCSRA